MRELDDALTTLRRELDGLGLDASTVDQLVDHLACAVEARVAAGDDVARAIADARTRLGDLGELAREHARVRGAFGPRPSRLQAYVSIVAMLGFVFVLNDSYAVRELLTGTGVLTLVALVGLAFRLPQASAFLLGQASVTLWLGLGHGLLPSAFAGERYGFTLLVLAIVPVILLGRGRMTRWRIAMIALGWTTSTMLFYIDAPGRIEELVFVILVVVLAVAVFAVAVRARIARPLTIAIAAMFVVVGARFFGHYLAEPWLHPTRAWPYHAAWWHVGRACQRAHLVISYVAPVVAAIFALRADRSIRAILGELRTRFARDPDAPA